MSGRLRTIVSFMLACTLVVGLVPSAGAAPAAPSRAETARAKIAEFNRTADRGRVGGVSESRAQSRSKRDFVPGELIVRYEKGASAAEIRSANTRAGAVSARKLGKLVPGLTKVRLKQGASVAKAAAAYEKQPGVLYAEPNYISYAQATPNDSLYSQLWGMNNTGQTGGTADADIDAPEAWNVTTGSSDVVIAVIDTGIDYNHPDLANNVWTNAIESTGTVGVDDDGNGYIDDIHGWDAVNEDGDPMDDNGHGTHCAGTIAGQGNNATGVAGVNWNAKVMGVKFLDYSGSGNDADAIEAFEYVASNSDVVVVSNSWGGGDFSQAKRDAIAAIDKLFVFAAGNGGPDGVGDNTDTHPYYPASYDAPNILAVGASDDRDARTSFSNFGFDSVDVFAPGKNVLSTLPGERTFTPAESGTLFSDSMNSLANWDTTQADHAWTTSGAAYVSPSTSAANVGYGNYQWNPLELANGIDCSSVTEPVYLKAKLRYNLEEGTGEDGDEGDVLVLWYQTPEVPSWDILAVYSGSTNGEFEDVLIDVTPYVTGQAGEKFSFDLLTDEAGVGGHVYLDDVKVVTGSSSSVATDNFTTSSAWTTTIGPHGWMHYFEPWAISSTRSVSGPSSLALTDYNGTGQYPNDEWASAYHTDGVDPGATGLTFMRYKVWNNIVSNPDPYDGGDYFLPTFDIIEDPYDPYIAALPRTGNSGGWLSRATWVAGQYGLPIACYGFDFKSDESGTAEGVYVDDVDIRSVNGTWGDPEYVDPYASWNGTSMATPHVAGIAGLMLAVDPTLTPAQLKSTIMSTVDKKASLNGLCQTGGRVNAFKAVGTTKGAIKGTVRWNGYGGTQVPIAGASVRVDGQPVTTTASNGTYWVGGLAPGPHKITVWKSGHITQIVNGVSTTLGSTATRNFALARVTVKPSIARSPNKSKLTYRRKNGVAKFKLSATVKGWGGQSLRGRRVYLQSSRTGTGGWKNTYALTTNSYGKATKSFKAKKRGTRYYRWYVPARSGVNFAGYSSKQKVIVR